MEIYKAAGNLCAVNLEDLQLPIPNDEGLAILQDHGFRVVEVDIVKLAYSSIGNSTYQRGVSLAEAPGHFDCSSMMQWLYGQKGIWLPRHSIDQRHYCDIEVEESEVKAGDLVFTTGLHNYYWDDPDDEVGHVGMATGAGTVIHAANSKLGVIESPLVQFIKEARGIRRVTKSLDSLITIESPIERPAEWSRQFRWIIAQYCK